MPDMLRAANLHPGHHRKQARAQYRQVPLLRVHRRRQACAAARWQRWMVVQQPSHRMAFLVRAGPHLCMSEVQGLGKDASMNDSHDPANAGSRAGLA